MILLARKLLPITGPPVDNGALVIKGKVIEDMGARKDVLKRHPGERVVDLGGRLVMPGLVNPHTHLDLSNLKGLVEGKDFFDWIFSLVEQRRRLGSRGLAGSIKGSLRELLSTGTTCIGDISSTDKALPVIVKSGIRAVSFLEVIGPGNAGADEVFARLTGRLKGLGGKPGRITAGIAPHSPYSVSPKLIKQIAKFILSNNIRVAIHISETKDESLYLSGRPSGLDRYFRHFGWRGHKHTGEGSSLQYLKGLGIGSGLLAVHAVNLASGDIGLLKKSGASVVHCPRSNHLLRVGRARVGEMIKRGVNVALGTDSLASNIDLDLWEEMRFAYLVNDLPAKTIIEMATINGARALGLGKVTGSLEPGKEADVIAVHTPAAMLDDPYRALLLGTRKGDVSATLVQGMPLHSTDGYISDGF